MAFAGVASPLGSGTPSADALRDPTLAGLRGRSAADPKAAVREAAKQFESLFMQEVMKSMRQATQSSGMLDNAGTQLGTDLLDTQFANQLTGLKGGLGEVIARQLERQMGGMAATASTSSAGTAAPKEAALAPAAAAGAPARGAAATGPAAARQADFLQRNAAAAKAAEAETGIPAAFLLGQAAHESGWGRREIRNADGSSAHNLFGIKAGAAWKGATTEVTTTEYIGGTPRKLTQKFRAYASAGESFRDYAKLMKDNPRYGPVLANASSAESFARGLQKAGYATDPAYADKLGRVIATTLRLQQATQQAAQALPARVPSTAA